MMITMKTPSFKELHYKYRWAVIFFVLKRVGYDALITTRLASLIWTSVSARLPELRPVITKGGRVISCYRPWVMDVAKQTVWYYFHERYRRNIRGLISKQINDVHIVDEIEQETWLGVFCSLPRFHGWSKKRKTKVTPRTWIITIANNKVCDYIRRKVRQPRFVNHDEKGNDLLASVADLKALNRPLAGVLVKEQEQTIPPLLEAWLEELSPAEKDAVERVYFRRMSQRESACDIGISIEALRIRLFRARPVLRRLWAEMN